MQKTIPVTEGAALDAAFNSLFEMHAITSRGTPSGVTDSAFNSLFEMQYLLGASVHTIVLMPTFNSLFEMRAVRRHQSPHAAYAYDYPFNSLFEMRRPPSSAC